MVFNKNAIRYYEIKYVKLNIYWNNFRHTIKKDGIGTKLQITLSILITIIHSNVPDLNRKNISS